LWTFPETLTLRDTGEVFSARKSGETPITRQIGPAVERRKGIRYRMNASVLFRWSGPDHGQYQGEGVTRDMSVVGAFVVTSTCPPPNSAIQMEVYLPLSDGGSRALMKSEMTVLRVEHDIAGNKQSGFSAVGKGFSLRTFSDRASRLVDGLIKESEESLQEQE